MIVQTIPFIPSKAFPTFILSQRLESRLNFPELKSKMINTNDHWAWSICRPKWMFVYTCETILHSQNPQLEWGTKLGLKIPKKKSTKRAERILYWQMSWMRHSSPIPYWNFQFGRNMSTMCKDFHWKILECVQRNISRFGLKILEYLECKEIFQVIWKKTCQNCVF